ncbi:hypothetical protein BGZ83_000431 [Gryganskiella cystojenkinii]|nr:hypothetical protein BGZ83_000431 [Gryganskiella cystojenkinii]
MDNTHNSYSHHNGGGGSDQPPTDYYSSSHQHEQQYQYNNTSVQPSSQEAPLVSHDLPSTPLQLQDSTQPLHQHPDGTTATGSSYYFDSQGEEDNGHFVEDYEDSLDYAPPAKALVLQVLTTLSTIVFTVLPVVIKAGKDATWGDWYSWRDAVRLIEPFCNLMSRYPSETEILSQRRLQRRATRRGVSQVEKAKLQSDYAAEDGILMENRRGIVSSYDGTGAHSIAMAPSASRSPLFKSTLATVFTFFLILYVTGAGIHTAAAFFKNTIVLFLEQYSQGIGLSTHPPTEGDGQLPLALAIQLKEGYLLIQDTWEHTISHYMYAFGALGMSWCEIIAYSSQVLPKGVNLARVGHWKSKGSILAGRAQSSKRLVVLWAVAGVLYGGIVAGVACQYPKGLYVGSAYVVLLFLCVSAAILFSRRGGYFSLGRHYILQTYLIGMVIAAVAIVAYMAIHHFNMITSNDQSHLDSINRP